MERLLYFLPEKPQPVWVRYATTTVVMAFCIAVQIGLEGHTGFVGLFFFFLLPGIFAVGLMFDRGSFLCCCHLIHDRPHHLAQRRITYLLRRALGDLFLGPYSA